MELNYKAAALTIGCEPACIEAVDTVESNGGGMLDGKPVILYEPHIFWKQLREHGIDPNKYATQQITAVIDGKKMVLPCDDANDPILYPVWGARPYPKGQAAQWARLDRAARIHREAGLESCSWGRYQICGFNWENTGSKSLQDFINRMFKGDAEHLNMFVHYIKKARLDDELIHKDWAGFARGYNGSAYARNKYDKKLLAAYLAAKKTSALK